MAYVTTVGSSTVPLIEDTPDVVRQSVMGSITNGTNIATDLMNTLTNTYSHKVRRAYQYARDSYYYGLPEGTVGRLSVNPDDIKSVLDKLIVLKPDEDYALVTTTVDNLIGINFAKEFFRNTTSDFDPVTGIVKGAYFTQYEDSAGNIIDLDPNNSETFYGTGVLVGAVYVDETHLRARIEQYDNDPDFPPRTYIAWQTFEIINSNINKLYMATNQFYYYAEYYIFDKTTGSQVGFNHIWNYWEGANTYPELSKADDILGTSYYMPIVPLRINNTMLIDESKIGTPQYETSKELLNILGLDITELNQGILDSPDVDKVDHAYVTLGVNVFSEKKETLKYLYEYFRYLYGGGRNQNYVLITDETYKTKLTWDSISLEITEGNFGKVGDVTKEIVLRGTPYLEISKQITPTVIHTFKVVDLALHNYIYQTTKSVVTALDAMDQDNDEALVIPINISIIEQEMSPLEANTVYYDALRMVFNSYDRIKLKWYQTGLFKAVAMVISVALSVITYGASGWLVGLVVGTSISMAVQLLAKYALKIFGDEIGSVIVAVATVVAIYYGYSSGFIPDITGVINTAINVASASLGAFIEFQMDSLITSQTAFQEEAKELMDQVEEVNAELEASHQLDPLGIFNIIGMAPGQSIDNYYYSKLQLPITYGTSGIDMIHSWVDTQLQLPTLMR